MSLDSKNAPPGASKSTVVSLFRAATSFSFFFWALIGIYYCSGGRKTEEEAAEFRLAIAQDQVKCWHKITENPLASAGKGTLLVVVSDHNELSTALVDGKAECRAPGGWPDRCLIPIVAQDGPWAGQRGDMTCEGKSGGSYNSLWRVASPADLQRLEVEKAYRERITAPAAAPSVFDLGDDE